MFIHLFALTIAFILDLFLGDPAYLPHPVKLFGKMIQFIEKHWNKNHYQKIKGVFMVALLIIVVLSLTVGVVLFSYTINIYFGLFVEAILIWTTIAQKGLGDAAQAVEKPLKYGDLPTARDKLAQIVGRDTEQLSEGEIVRATIETVAENTSDAITAPMFWASIGGAPLAIIYRLINTCDSMVGYKNKRYSEFGWASARLDDVVNLIPARLTGIMMISSYRTKMVPMKKAWSILWQDSNKHPSPNSGWGEAAVAASLGIKLGGVNYYDGEKSYRTEMGEEVFKLNIDHISESLMIMRRTSIMFLLFILIGGFLIEFTITRF